MIQVVNDGQSQAQSENFLNQLKESQAQAQVFNKFNSPQLFNKSCPNCGYCSCCGRSNHHYNYPYYQHPQFYCAITDLSQGVAMSGLTAALNSINLQ